MRTWCSIKDRRRRKNGNAMDFAQWEIFTQICITFFSWKSDFFFRTKLGFLKEAINSKSAILLEENYRGILSIFVLSCEKKKNNCCSFYKLMQIFSITSSYVVSNKEFYYFSEMLSYCARTSPHDGPLWGQSHFGIGILFSYQHRNI